MDPIAAALHIRNLQGKAGSPGAVLLERPFAEDLFGLLQEIECEAAADLKAAIDHDDGERVFVPADLVDRILHCITPPPKGGLRPRNTL